MLVYIGVEFVVRVALQISWSAGTKTKIAVADEALLAVGSRPRRPRRRCCCLCVR